MTVGPSLRSGIELEVGFDQVAPFKLRSGPPKRAMNKTSTGPTMTHAHSQYLIVIDDDPMIARVIEKALTRQVRSFTSGAAFAAAAGLSEPMGVIIDINLGVGDSGLDLIPSVRSRWPYVPVLVITSDAASETVGPALASGANDFVRKPIEAQELRARLQARSIEMEQRAARGALTFGELKLGRVAAPPREWPRRAAPLGSRYAAPRGPRAGEGLAHSERRVEASPLGQSEGHRQRLPQAHPRLCAKR